ncbi:MAG: hypothetical protein WCF65_06975 [Parachlamydiaceae bacterium]
MSSLSTNSSIVSTQWVFGRDSPKELVCGATQDPLSIIPSTKIFCPLLPTQDNSLKTITATHIQAFRPVNPETVVKDTNEVCDDGSEDDVNVSSSNAFFGEMQLDDALIPIDVHNLFRASMLENCIAWLYGCKNRINSTPPTHMT